MAGVLYQHFKKSDAYDSIKKGDVLVMLLLMLLNCTTKGMHIRNENGSQLIATAVRSYLKEKVSSRSSLM